MISDKRVQQINETIRQELSQVILREVEFDLGTMVTIIRTSTDSELKNIKIFLRVFPENKERKSLNLLNKRKPFLQSLLKKKIILRYIPQIRFFIDIKGKEEEIKIDRMEELFREIEK
ncbi:MAG: 30S ribosome-binding factor RbfA [Patescibacteria group bacterium]